MHHLLHCFPIMLVSLNYHCPLYYIFNQDVADMQSIIFSCTCKLVHVDLLHRLLDVLLKVKPMITHLAKYSQGVSLQFNIMKPHGFFKVVLNNII